MAAAKEGGMFLEGLDGTVQVRRETKKVKIPKKCPSRKMLILIVAGCA
jgi:hypothetical protein